MKTIKDFKALLNDGKEEFNGNTILGMHLNSLFGRKDIDATIHDMEEKIEVIVRMEKNGINCFTDSYKMGSVTKAYYQWHLEQYSDFQ
jgi:hypothetical protein